MDFPYKSDMVKVSIGIRWESNRIEVDGDACIHCGKCLEVCPHNAREYRDDTAAFLKDLRAGEKISLLVAPSFFCCV